MIDRTMKFKLADGTTETFTLEPWVKSVAQDRDGEWWKYARNPVISSLRDEWDAPANCDFICKGIPPEDFTKELYEVYLK